MSYAKVFLLSDNSFVADSDVIRLSALGNNIVVVNTISAAMELFERRSSMYSDRSVIFGATTLLFCAYLHRRPRMVMLTEL